MSIESAGIIIQVVADNEDDIESFRKAAPLHAFLKLPCKL
jgi:hypothetical protein